MDDTEARAFRRVWRDDIAIFIRETRWTEGRAKRFAGRSIVFEEMTDGSYEPDPTFSLSEQAAQSLMDELWHAGLRPTRGKQSEGVTAAQGRHLEDMRAIAFAKLNVSAPNG